MADRTKTVSHTNTSESREFSIVLTEKEWEQLKWVQELKSISGNPFGGVYHTITAEEDSRTFTVRYSQMVPWG